MDISNKDRASILHYWQSIELLQPQSIPTLKRRENPHEPYIHNSDLADGYLPWESRSLIKDQPVPKNNRWSHLLYARIFDFRIIVNGLEEHFGAEQGYKETGPTMAALFALRFTQEGKMVEDSLVLSSAAWMYGQLIRGLSWTRGFEEAQEEARTRAAQLLSEITTQQKLDDLIGWIVSLLGLNDLLARVSPKHRFVSTPLKQEAQPTDDPLNSFILDDLIHVANAVSGSDSSSPLDAYLNLHPESQRTDISSTHSAAWLTNQLQPALHPPGCWPTEKHLGLVHSQQLAVNVITHCLTDSEGLLSVNGPPGTGKTTLLRDIVAAAITRRADELAQFKRASEAFLRDGLEELTVNGRTMRVFKLVDSLFGHEIVVASSNNGAVENVTLELPQRDKVDPSWLGDDDHFSDIGEVVSGQEAWGLISAALGNKSNRSKFVSRFWFNKESLADLRQSRKQPPAPKDDAGVGEIDELAHEPSGSFTTEGGASSTDAQPGPTNFKDYLDIWDAENLTSDQRFTIWTEAVTRYNQAKKEEKAIRERAATAGALIRLINDSKKKIASTRNALEKALADKQALQTAIGNVHAEWAPAHKAMCAQTANLEQHAKDKPGLLSNLLTLWKAGRQWQSTYDFIEQKLKITAQECEVIASKLRQLETKFTEQESQIGLTRDQLSASIAARDKYIADAMALAKQFGANHLSTWLSTDAPPAGDAIELAEPWRIPGWRQARARVFMEALALQRTFFRMECRRIRSNLSFAISILEGNQLKKVSRAAIRSAWATLFMAVPVLSSTFASFSRTFKTLHAGDIGWLLVDEAGQATPQAAVGALWRSRRAVLVGDPLQLKPVITVPESVMEHMRTGFRVSTEWMPQLLSAQRLGDLANPFGRMLGPAGAKQWVGLPLTVHRRCDHPMFELANRIAYDHAMVYGTIAPSIAKETPASMRTGWIDVNGSSSTNWIAEEGQALMRLLTQLKADGVAHKDISVITPFTAVRDQLRQMLRAPMVFGTIHTMQGKESPVVILVLGGRSDSPGAREWAVSEPNLLNVAATRAKRRLYVIGNRRDWSNRRLFCQVMDLLPPIHLKHEEAPATGQPLASAQAEETATQSL